MARDTQGTLWDAFPAMILPGGERGQAGKGQADAPRPVFLKKARGLTVSGSVPRDSFTLDVARVCACTLHKLFCFSTGRSSSLFKIVNLYLYKLLVGIGAVLTQLWYKMDALIQPIFKKSHRPGWSGSQKPSLRFLVQTRVNFTGEKPLKPKVAPIHRLSQHPEDFQTTPGI